MVSGSDLRKVLRKALILVSLITFVISLLSVIQHWDYKETLSNISTEIHLRVTQKDFEREINQAINESRFDDAKTYLTIAESNQYPLQYQKLQAQIKSKDTTINQISSSIVNFGQGFIEGKSTNLAGVAGSVTADFTIIGDARDLYQQYIRYDKGEDVNELIVVLSGAGIGLTAVTVGTLGSAAPAKAGTSVLKLAAKTQRVTLRFQKVLLKQGRKVFNWSVFKRLIKENKSLKNIRYAAKQAYHPEAVKPLGLMAKRVANIRNSTSTIDAVHLLKYVENTDDLRHLEKFTVKHGSQAKGLLKLLGKGALRTTKILKKTTSLIISLISSIFSAFFGLLVFFVKFNS